MSSLVDDFRNGEASSAWRRSVRYDAHEELLMADRVLENADPIAPNHTRNDALMALLIGAVRRQGKAIEELTAALEARR